MGCSSNICKGSKMQAEIQQRASEKPAVKLLRPHEVVEKIQQKISSWAKIHSEIGSSFSRKDDTLFIKFTTSVNRARRGGREVSLNSTQILEIENFIELLCKIFALEVKNGHKGNTSFSYEFTLPPKESTIYKRKEN
jgi:hypothetical protein